MPTATPAQLAMLFSTLAISASLLTCLIVILSHLISIWLLVFSLCFMLVWMILDCITIYADLKLRDTPTLQHELNEKQHLITIYDMAIQAEELKKRILTLTRTVNNYNTTSLANIHWKVMHNKAMSMYYTQLSIQLSRQASAKSKDSFKAKRRFFMKKWCYSMTDLPTELADDPLPLSCSHSL